MKYLNIKQLKHEIDTNLLFPDFVEQMQDEVEFFFSNFKDSPQKTSRWAHHYFCSNEGGLLIFNELRPHSHICSVCGKEYSNELLDGVWLCMYRNTAVINTWKSAVLFKVTGEKKYLDNVVQFCNFYNDHYEEFVLHNKEGEEFSSNESMKWGASRIMPQSLNESIFLIRMINALELVKEDLSDDYLNKLHQGIFKSAFTTMQSQIIKVHNIPTWLNCGIGVMGLFFEDQEMLDCAFKGPFNIFRQLREGVTSDKFWYEGSIHYNYFLLEGVVNLGLFCELYDYNFSPAKELVEEMLINGYNYAFDNYQLPNPNDGWPDVNLKSYSYIYSIAVKIYGGHSLLSPILTSILNAPGERGVFPLSKPYYFKNNISLEEFLFAPDIRKGEKKAPPHKAINFKTSFCGMIRKDKTNIFLKYGHNGPSHAHPDKMNIEVLLNGTMISRDLSNSGYGNPFCNQWHRVSASHNTVVIDGQNHSGFGGGECEIFENDHVLSKSPEVYSGVDFQRELKITENGFTDNFKVSSKKTVTGDFFFHVEGKLINPPQTQKDSLGFNDNGYQHLKNLEKVISLKDSITLCWKIKDKIFGSVINLKNTDLYLAESPNNPVTGFRKTIVLRQKGLELNYEILWNVL